MVGQRESGQVSSRQVRRADEAGAKPASGGREAPGVPSVSSRLPTLVLYLPLRAKQNSHVVRRCALFAPRRPLLQMRASKQASKRLPDS